MSALYSWEQVFNAKHGIWGHISNAAEAANRAGYLYFTWNDLVYKIVLVGVRAAAGYQQMGEEGNWHSIEDIR